MKSFSRHIFRIVGLILMMSCLTACRHDIKWIQTEEVDQNGWLPTQPVEFDLDPPAYLPKPENRFAEITARAIGDTLPRYMGTYKATLAIRYNNRCNVSRIDIIAEKVGLDEPITTDTIRIPLFDNDGNPEGTGHLGIYEKSIDLYPFKVADGTMLSLRPADYSESVKGITDVTLILSDKKQ